MPLPIIWTPGLDSELRRMRQNKISWDAIGFALGVCRNSALARGARLGLCRTRGPSQEPVAPALDSRTSPPPHWHVARRDAAPEHRAPKDGERADGDQDDGDQDDGDQDDGDQEGEDREDGAWGGWRRGIWPRSGDEHPALAPERAAVRLAEAWAASQRPPLAAGDPVSWAVLTDNTLLEGTVFAMGLPERPRRDDAREDGRDDGRHDGAQDGCQDGVQDRPQDARGVEP